VYRFYTAESPMQNHMRMQEKIRSRDRNTSSSPNDRPKAKHKKWGR